MMHKAIALGRPGDVIVVDAGGDLTNAISQANAWWRPPSHGGLAGFVINGAIRDVAWIRTSGFPVFAAGVTHRGPYKNGPGEVNHPIALSGMVIMPGDVIVGDDDGMLAVPLADAPGHCHRRP